MQVSLNIELNEFPKKVGTPIKNETTRSQGKTSQVKLSMTRNKFLQFSKDMREALKLMEKAEK